VVVPPETKNKYLLYDDDIVIARTGASTGASSYIHNPPEAVFASYLVRLKIKPDFDSRYISYFLKSEDFWTYIRGVLGDKSAQPNASASTMTKAQLRIPVDKNTQRAIAHILGTLDEKIELNRKMNQTLEAIAQALFKSWFVDFDPVYAKAEGRDTGLPEHIANLFPDSFEDSELGKIPRGWDIKIVDEISTTIFSGGTPNTRINEYWNGKINWFSSGETRNHFVIGTENKITQAGVNNSSTRLAIPGDILIASAGQGHTRGQTCYCTIETYINQSVVSIRSDMKKTSSLWLFYNLLGRYEEMRRISDSHSSRGSLTTKLLSEMKIILPDFSLIELFTTLIDPLVIKQVANGHQSNVIATIRNTILPKIISGEMHIKNIERFLGWTL
jgi:type I restriction enzyme S subunit